MIIIIITINFRHSKSRLSVDELSNNKFHHIASVNTVTECNHDKTKYGLIKPGRFTSDNEWSLYALECVGV